MTIARELLQAEDADHAAAVLQKADLQTGCLGIVTPADQDRGSKGGSSVRGRVAITSGV